MAAPFSGAVPGTVLVVVTWAETSSQRCQPARLSSKWQADIRTPLSRVGRGAKMSEVETGVAVTSGTG